MMNRIFFKIILSGMFIFMTCFPLYADMSAKDIVNKVKKSYNKQNNIAVEFKQIFEWKLAGKTRETTGKLFIKDKNKYRIEMPQQTIVTDGKTLWQYSMANQQVLIDVIQEKDENQLPSKMLFRYSEDYNVKLIGSEVFNGLPCYVLQLTSKTGDNFIQEMKTWIDKASWLTRKIENQDINGNLNTYIIQAITTNIKLQESLFTFKTPEGVQEVDLRVK
ncbi:outer membrane lipoprotein carrier protein LolA [candidate division KSB1 bacterium]|nr:outer membrane lipoprotein carrier protein LolA [candidate division KSB1 bacterium]